MVNETVIPAEAVEAAAKALAVQAWGEWEYVPDELRKAFIRDAKITLEAAAPYLLAQGWDEGWQACVNYSTYPELDGETPTSDNPYRPTGTNPSETIRQLIQEWVNNNKQGEK